MHDPLQQSTQPASAVAGAGNGLLTGGWFVFYGIAVGLMFVVVLVLTPQVGSYPSRASETQSRMWKLGELVRMHGIQQMRRGGREAMRLAAIDVAAEDRRDAWGASLVVRIEGDDPHALRVVVTSPGADQLWGTPDDLQYVAGK